MKYIVQYSLPYEHRVMVGIEAASREAAIARAEELFDQGEIWNDTPELPLLFDDFEECGDAGVPLTFTVEGEVTGDWPAVDSSVMEIRRREAAFRTVRLLVEAYRRGEERGGTIDWEDLGLAYQAALETSGSFHAGRGCSTACRMCKRLAVVIEGGVVQSVVADRPDAAPAVAVIDYDAEGIDPDLLRTITQPAGHTAKAWIIEPNIEHARIDLNEVFPE